MDQIPQVVVVGSASRDLVAGDPRGWRLGGGVSYSALTTARLGLRTGAIIGVDEAASRAAELDLLREAGVDVHPVLLEHGPVFENIERPEGRLQHASERSDPLPADAVPGPWRASRGWILAPVAAELPDAWADLPPPDATIAVGWQGLLRRLTPGQPVQHLRPAHGPILARADLVGVSRDDLDPAMPMAELSEIVGEGGMLVVTEGDRGGLAMQTGPGGPRHIRHYPAVRSHNPVDPTGAGDVFLAALAAARIEPRLVSGRIGSGLDFLLAAAAASLVLEGPGMLGVPDRQAVRGRMREAVLRPLR